IELPHFAVGSPPDIALSRLSQVQIRDLREPARRVEAGSQLISKRLVVDKAVCACRRDGALVQVHGLEWASLDTGNLGADERGTILEILRAIRRPCPKLSLVPPNCFSLLGASVEADGIALCGPSQRGIEVIVRLLQDE